MCYHCIWELHVSLDDLYLLILGKLCAWVESTWSAVGVVDRCGQHKQAIFDTCGLYQTIGSILKPVFHWFQQIHCVYGSVWCLDLDIWQFSWQWQTNRCCPQVRSCNYRYNYPAKCLSLFKLVWTSVGLRPRLEYIASMRASTCVAEPWQEEI